MTILISGGAGFIGSHLVERLLSDGEGVHVVDDLRSAVWTRDDLDNLLTAPVAAYHTRPIQESEKILHWFRLDSIFHLASPVGPAGILPYRGKIVEEIVSATYAVIRIALRHKCRLVYVSSSEVYGGGQQGLCREDMPCVVPVHEPSARLEYAIGKLAGEIAVLNTPGLDAVIIRPFNVAGPRQSRKGGFVLPTFVQQALAGERTTVFGTGDQIRAFTHVQDIVHGLILAMQTGKTGQIYNLGNPDNKTSIFDLACKVNVLASNPAGHCFANGQAVYGPDYREANDKYPNAEKAMTELGWRPTRSIEETIQDVIAYERSRIGAR